MSKIILVTKLKGGAGATTTCRELCAVAISQGLSVGLIDLDGQGGLTNWWNRRTADNIGNQNPTLLQVPVEKIEVSASSLRETFDLVIIDSPPSVNERILQVARVADLAIVPTRPNIDDLDAVGPIMRLLRGVVDMTFVITQTPGKRSLDAAEATELLARHAPVLGRTTLRAAYPRAASTGSTGYENERTATEEISTIWSVICDRIDIAPKQRSGEKVKNRSGYKAKK
ncbi:ParA family protein [Neokomagataea anthophila]|uniref:ParA family protein n=1 Tax=Neokomagataea anthophila TaxID=2826925 RepID=A0ABS5E9V5_9PROT|nr:ParA family protein [Neokomagataea anthophila]MBR0560695.1 ParA family protein [Neokomagataea anthophila]